MDLNGEFQRACAERGVANFHQLIEYGQTDIVK